MTDNDAARFATVGLLVLRRGGVDWHNDAARGLVEPHGGDWRGPASPAGLLVGLRPGSGPTPVRWPSPVAGTRWWRVTATTIEASTDAVLYEITDETALYDADGRDLGEPTAQWRLARMEVMAGMGSWVWHVDSGEIEWSEALLVRFGLPPGTRLDYAATRELIHPDDREMVRLTLTTAIDTGRPFTYRTRLFVQNGTERVFECHGEVFADAAGVPTRLYGTARDITEEHHAAVELAFLAGHDPLTGVANRRRIIDWLTDCAGDRQESALLLIDIDNFKDINDLRGHAVGDGVIRRVADTIGARTGSDAQLGRLGGDEFAVVVRHSGPEAAVHMAEELCDALAATTMIDEVGARRVTVSIGVTTIVRGQDATVSLAQADLALYEAKNAGRNRARLFTPEHHRQAARRVALLQRVESALESGTMHMDAQAIVDIRTGRTSRYELLIRLRDGLEPALGPADFLPPAERTDLVLRLDRWVLDRAVRALAATRSSGLRLEVNLSARSLEDDDIGTFVLHRLEESDVDPRRLGLEITETAAIASLPAARLLADRLTGAGCGFSLDDFGAGYGSFSHLKNLPFSAIKIAGEFVRQVDTDPVDQALVSALVTVSRQLGMRTVAEQVDRAPLLSQLRTLGVDDAQGFLLGAPRPLADLLREEGVEPRVLRSVEA